MRGPTNIVSHLGWLRPFLFSTIVFLVIASVSRLGLMIWLSERVAATDGFWKILIQGLRFDLVTLGLFLAVPMLATPIISRLTAAHSIWFVILRWYLIVLLGLLLLTEMSTPSFIAEYDVRPNFLFVEYLKYPREVFAMLSAAYAIDLVAGVIVIPLVLWFVYRGLRTTTRNATQSHRWSAIPLAFLSLAFCVMAARSTLDHRPVNPSNVAFSADTLVNSLPLNSLYSVAFAIYELRHEDEGFPLGSVGKELSTEAIKAAMYLPESAFLDGDIPTLHFQPATMQPEKPKNLVILVEESLGAEFVGSLGGLPLTPNLDEISNDGIWFEQLYATGTRSARGLEAIVTGFPPTTSQSVLKLGRAQSDFFTLGEYLRRAGYETSFIYGGEAHFDNMRRFFANNGFDLVVDKHDFDDPIFVGSWGVADEDVFRLAHTRFASASTDQPFFTLLFTTSNHSPWEYPAARIENYDEPSASRNNSVKYADHALGQFIRAARQSTYWDNTVFLIVSDHNSRVAGANRVPIERFHIPGLILGGGVEPQRWQRRASQIDLLPTLLSLIGVSGAHPAVGIDLTREDIDEIPGRAIMQYGGMQAYWLEDEVVILRNGKAAEVLRYANGEYGATVGNPQLAKKAIALAEWPVRAYRDHSYRLP